MTPSQQTQVSHAPEFDRTLRKRLEAMPIKEIAADTGIDPSQVSKFLLGTAALKLDDVSKLMKVAKLKPVGEDRDCTRREELAFLRRLYVVVSDQAAWLLNEAEA